MATMDHRIYPLSGVPASELVAQEIRHAIGAVTNHEPSDADIARVRARLAAGGWPLARPERITDPAEFPSLN
jgi:Protein of unknown function (DUF3349)